MPVTRKYTAIVAPHGLKRPGEMLVAPRKHAANAGSRKVMPERRICRPGGPGIQHAGERSEQAGGDQAAPAHAIDANAAEPRDFTAAADEQQPAAQRGVANTYQMTMHNSSA